MRDLAELHIDALRRLARGLLYDRHRAEDVVQDAWLAALRKRPESAHLGTWLRTAVRHLALDVRRRDERRTRREAAVARAERVAGPDEVLGHVELLRRVLDALAALEEPYRTAIGLRFLEGLPPRAIAARLGLPVNTVRTHVRRGLESLRRRLDGPGGSERERFLAALVPLAGRPPIGALLGAPAATALGLGAAVLLVGGIGMLRTLRQRAGELDAPRTLAAPAREVAPTPAPSAAREREAASGREAAVSGWTVHAHVTRGRHGPLPGAPVRARILAGYAPDDAILHEAELVTDASGALVWDVAPAETSVRVELEARPDGHLSARAIEYVPLGQSPRAVLVLECLPLDAELHGTIRDPAGAPVAGARLALGPERDFTSDAEGRYRVAFAAQEVEPTLFVAGPGALVARLALAPFRSDESRALDLDLAPATQVRGQVRDESGAPLAGTRVASFWHAYLGASFGTATTDETGHYELLLEPGEEWIDLLASRPGSSPEARQGALQLGEERGFGPRLDPARIDFVLSPGLELSGRVVDPTGVPLAGAWVSVSGPHPDARRVTTSDAAGRFTLVGLVRGGSLRAGRPGHGSTRLELAQEEPAGDQDLVLVLEPGRSVSGRVLDAGGAPIPWARVWGSAGQVHADEHGAFLLEGVPERSLHLYVSARGFADATHELDGTSTDLELRLAPQACLAGRVLDASTGAPIPRFTLRLLEPDDLGNRAGGVPWTDPLAMAGADGTWRLAGGLSAGLVVAVEARAEGYAPALAPRLESALEAAPDACVLRLVPATRIRGVVVDAASGAPLEGARVWSSTRPAPSDEHPHAMTDVHGRFELHDLPTGPTSLHVARISHAPHVDGPFLLEGECERRIALGHGATISGRLLDPQGTGLAGEEVTLRSVDARGQIFTWTTRSEDEGRFVFRNLLAGEYRVAWKRQETLEPGAPVGASVMALGSLGYVRDLPDGTQVVSLDLVDSVALGAGEALEVVLQARGRGALSGTVRGPVMLPTHLPVSLVLLDEAGQPTPRARGTLAEGGAFRFTHLVPGRYELSAELALGTTEPLTGRALVEVPEEGEASAVLELGPAR